MCTAITIMHPQIIDLAVSTELGLLGKKVFAIYLSVNCIVKHLHVFGNIQQLPNVQFNS